MADIKITFPSPEGAFDRDVQRNSLGQNRQPFTSSVKALIESADCLYRDDDFGQLKIDKNIYRKRDPNHKYGITPLRPGSVIFQHQVTAAEKFLKELRGFGLLADVVGSGKTFEACVILSELAVRNKIGSLLLIVPEQVLGSWKTVLEENFGLGKGVLQQVGKDCYFDEEELRSDDGFNRPIRPVIVTMEDFVEWNEETKDYMFDVIVVDEAHHLCSEEGKYARAMRLLSLLMQTKRRANSTYCLLLSATPHSGNLDHMFRLWYFIRCKGGDPNDFLDRRHRNPSSRYESEQRYYKETVCRGATTVMEFINIVKIDEVEKEHRAEFVEWLSQAVGKAEADFQRMQNKRAESELVQLKKHKEDYLKGTITFGSKLTLINKFLKVNDKIHKEVRHKVANAYHNGVLRSIMIRQKHQDDMVSREKRAVNYLFFPMEKQPELIKGASGLQGKKVDIDLAHFGGGDAVICDGVHYSVDEYIKTFTGSTSYATSYANFIAQGIINKVGAKEPIFIKEGTGQYYWDQMLQFEDSFLKTNFLPYKYDLTDVDNFQGKMKVATDLLEKHAGERVLVFFDYDKKEKNPIWDRFEAELRKDPRFKNRILVGTQNNKNDICDDKHGLFNKEEYKDAILIVKDAGFTEGANLQKSNVIINFQISPDPLAMDQRIGRIFRLGQTNDVTIYSLSNMHQLEGYVLAYFSCIGLLTSNSGDVTIIAGSNNDHMVTIRCSACGRVELLSRDEFESRKSTGQLYCTASEKCTVNNSRGTLMEEISVYNFKCATCDTVFERSVTEEGYLCVSTNDSGKSIMCNSGKLGDRELYCKKICAMSHCKQFSENGRFSDCPAVNLFRQNKNISSIKLKEVCFSCSRTKHKDCPTECRFGTEMDDIFYCSTCQNATCNPKPHIIRFNDEWQADCPKCGERRHGKLVPIAAKTFATYINELWKFQMDNGAGFCDNLKQETDKVMEIKIILNDDSESNGGN